jgi:hypothetical protein
MLLPALLAVLAAAPAAASSDDAVRPPPCLRVSSGTATMSLDELLACQDRARAEAVKAAASKGKPLTSAQLDQFDESQRAEARKLLAAAEPKGKLGGVTPADLRRTDAKSAAAIKGLQSRMQTAAGDGNNGVTPAMADDVRATLTRTQGGVSPEMSALLDGVQRDGGKLTPETMKLLQGAGKSAKGEGLDLNVDPGVEKLLLQTDFDKEKPEGAPPPAGM